MGRDVVFILTGEDDTEVDPVIVELSRRAVDVFRYDVSYFPRRSVMAAECGPAGWLGSLTANDRSVELARIRSVWHRRPTHFEFDPAMPRQQRQFAFHEARRGLGGVLQSLDEVVWVNDPEREASADFKPRQLATASGCGFQVPRTIITNHPDAVRSFHEECNGEIVYKTLSYPHIVRSADGPSHQSMLTTKLEGSHLEILDRVRHTACMFQELVPKRCDVRVVVTGQRVLAAEIDSQRSARTEIDFRASLADVRFGMHQLPPETEDQCRSLLATLGLMTGSIDLVQRPDGAYVFLEVNPSGQAMWLESAAGLPVASAMADLLAEGIRKAGTPPISG